MDTLHRIFGTDKPLVAMCHLLGLPGRPRHDASRGMDAVVEALVRDIDVLQGAGVDGLLFCNENDLPYQQQVGREVVAAMAAAIGRVHSLLKVPYGVDLLWDPTSALAVGRATGASFVREVFTGAFESDMGLLAPDLGTIAGYRRAISADEVALFANITPEFSRSISGRTVSERAQGAAYLGVDALLISGREAGVSAELAQLREAKAAAPDIPLMANTGVSVDNVEAVLSVADGVIVGTSLKVNGSTWNPVDPSRARELVAAVAAVRARATA